MKRLLCALAANLIFVTVALAQPYGSGAYNTQTYGGASPSHASIGGVTLPVTGPQLLGIVGIVCLSITASLVYWARRRRRSRLAV